MARLLTTLLLVASAVLAIHALVASPREVIVLPPAAPDVVVRPFVLPAPIVVAVAPPAPPAPVRAGCAAAPAEVGMPLDVLERLERKPPPAMSHVVAAAERCTIAVARDDVVSLSVDDGRSFAQALAGPGALRGLAAGADGTVYALRAPDRLGTQSTDGAVSWRRAPVRGDGAVALLVSGAWVGFIDDAYLLISNDGGRDWRWVALPDDADTTSVAFHVAGDTLRVALGRALHRGTLRGGAWQRVWTAPEAIGSVAFGDDGWLYAYLGDDPERMTLVAVSPSSGTRVLIPQSSPGVTAWPRYVVGNGASVVASNADSFVRLRHGRVVSRRFAGEGCEGGDGGQEPWPRYDVRAIDRHGLPLAERRDAHGALLRVAGCGRERALLAP